MTGDDVLGKSNPGSQRDQEDMSVGLGNSGGESERCFQFKSRFSHTLPPKFGIFFLWGGAIVRRAGEAALPCWVGLDVRSPSMARVHTQTGTHIQRHALTLSRAYVAIPACLPKKSGSIFRTLCSFD
jgi:hypothetical protein